MILKVRNTLLIPAIAILLSGCNLWTNFTTYFNLYYNTSDIFEQAESQIEEQEKNLFSTEDPVLPGSANTQLIKVIENCSEILQFHSESDYVDDALMMLGKAFYYQKNYQKALRKFEELQATQEAENEGTLETKLWIGKIQMKLKNYEIALSTLAEVRKIATDEDNEEILKEAFVEEIVYRISEEEYQEAITLSNHFLENSDDDDIKAEILFEVGKLYSKVNEPENAVTAFENALDYNPLYEIELGAKLELGKTLRIIGKNEEALEIFSDMKEEAKFIDAYGEIDLQIGITLKELDRIDEAVEKLIFTDTSYVNTPVSAVAKYKLGEIFEYDYQNFDSAGTYYQKSLASSLPKEYMTDVTQKIRTFKKYQHLKSQINKYSDQLFYIENPEIFSRDSLLFVQDSAAYVQDSMRVLEELTLLSEHVQSLTSLDTTLAGADTLLLKDTLALRDSLLNSTAGLDSAQVDSIIQIRRELAIKNQIAKSGLNIDSLFAEKWDEDRKFPVKPLKPNMTEDSLKTLLAKNEIEMGNLFLTEMELFDSAYYYYDHVLTFYPYTSHQANALYAMGSYYLNVDQKEKADSLFNFIYENYRNESIVNAAADKLNKPLIDLNFDPAKEIYEEAEHELLTDSIKSSLDKFYDIYKKHPKSSFAPKALYTSGWILENELNLFDSAAVIYDSLTLRYPQSEYAIKIRPRLNAYKQYKLQVQRAIEDSIKRIEEKKVIPEDSLALRDDVKDLKEPDDKTIKPGSEVDDKQKVKTPDIKLPSDTSRSVILNNPRRNPRKR